MPNRARRADRRQATVLTYLAPALVAHAVLFAVLTTFAGGNRLYLWWLSLSVVAFPLMGWDKLAARQGLPRVPEVVFHALSLSGGFAGTWLGMVAFRHKTMKPAFWTVVLLAAVMHLGIWYALYR